MVRALLVSALLALPVAARAPLHTWTDKEGVLHVEDVPPPPPQARSAPRKSPPAAQVSIPAPKRGERWWERRSPAPPDLIDRATAPYNNPAELQRAAILAESTGDAATDSLASVIGIMALNAQSTST